MLRKIAVLAVLVVVIAAAFASAANLPVSGGTILAGQDMSLACDTDGVDVDWGLETDDNTVRSVTISQISTACSGAEMFVHLTGTGTGYPVKVKAVLGNSGTQSFSFPAPYLDPAKIEGIKIWVEGYN